jgi:hypothetical protein
MSHVWQSARLASLARRREACLDVDTAGGTDASQPGDSTLPPDATLYMALIEVVNDHPVTATQEQREDAEQRGHRLPPEGQGAQEFADRQQQDGNPERGFIECAGNGDDKRG